MRRALLVADGCGLLLAFAATELLFGSPAGPGARLGTGAEIAIFGLTLPVWIILAKVYGLYDRDEERPAHTTIDDLIGVFHLVTVGVWIITVGGWLTGIARPDFGKVAFFWAAAVALIVATRSCARVLVRRTVAYRQRTVIVGSDKVAGLVQEKLRSRSGSGLEVLGCATERGEPSLADLPALGRPSDLPRIVSRYDIERVIIAQLDESQAPAIMRALRTEDVQIDFVPRPFEAVGLSGSVYMLDGVPMLGLSPTRLSRSSLALKRAMDVILSGLGLVILSPLIAVIGLKIKLDSAGPIFYRHDRIGHVGRPFRLLKFRTMYAKYCRGADYGGEEAEHEFKRLMQDPLARVEFDNTYKLQRDPRVTRFGAFLRRTSLDELPQLVNVLRGELSLVGPRPIVSSELERYGEDADRLLSLRPGVTGYWQINGRSDTSYAERVRLDVAYASSWSLGLDVAILAHTVRTLAASPHGAY